MTDRNQAILDLATSLVVLAGTVTLLLVYGPACNAPQKDQAAVMLKDIDRLGVALATVESRVATSQAATAGRDVSQRTNIGDAWTARTLAAGFAAIPLSFMFYMIAHRSPTLRKAIDAFKGKNGHNPI